uniref:Uncharacterized protein n=1 Tax=Timema shepardi TaxID=629360 RepID=A0A7R9AXK2_TIMSH|nr:unnamed protein product [Timema shepardi]
MTTYLMVLFLESLKNRYLKIFSSIKYKEISSQILFICRIKLIQYILNLIQEISKYKNKSFK